MAQDSRQGLQTIFSIFLGLMLTAFVGIGTYTFHPPPTALRDTLAANMSAQQQVRGRVPDEQLTEAQRAELRGLEAAHEQVMRRLEELEKDWRRSTSIILIVLATLAMAFSLVRADELPVVSNGLLLGGVFTMLYGIGWVIQGDSTVGRFAVITVALLVTLVLGYLRFVRGGRVAAARVVVPGAGSPELEQRIGELERRMNEAARALQARD